MSERDVIRKSLSYLHASGDTLQEVYKMIEKEKSKKGRPIYRTALIAAIIAVLLIGTAAAISYSSLSEGLKGRLRLTEEEAIALENTELVTCPSASDTHDGVTVAIEKAVVNGEVAHLALRIEGMTIPEGYRLGWDGPEVTIDGESAPGWGAGVYEGLHWNGTRFVYDDGTPAEMAEEGYPIPRVVREDGSVEFDIDVYGLGETGSLLGKEITVTLYRLGFAPTGYEPVEAATFTAEGPWVLTWTAEGSDTSRTWALNAPLGHGITVKSVTLSQLSAHIEYAFPPMTIVGDHAYDENGDEILEDPPELYTIVMKDGTEYSGVLGAGTSEPDVDEASELENGFTYSADMELTHVVDPDEVAALVFRAGEKGNRQTYTVALDG